jgi:hypothetical protein
LVNLTLGSVSFLSSKTTLCWQLAGGFLIGKKEDKIDGNKEREKEDNAIKQLKKTTKTSLLTISAGFLERRKK